MRMTAVILVVSFVGLADQACAQDAKSDVDTFVFDPANSHHERDNGNAALVLTPHFNDSNKRTIGYFCHPVIARSSSAANVNLTCYNMHLGDSDRPIPAGTKGKPSGYQANIDTDQSAADVGNDGAQGYGATMFLRNGSPFHAYSAALAIKNKPASGYAFDVNIDNYAGGGNQIGYNAGSGGAGAKNPAGTAFNVVGPWTTGLNLGGTNVVGATSVSFYSPTREEKTEYRIDGSRPDALRITGGGTSHGMIVYGGPPTNPGGLIRFRGSDAAQTDAAAIDTNTGNVTASAIVLRATNGHSCYRITVDEGGTLHTSAASCQ